MIALNNTMIFTSRCSPLWLMCKTLKHYEISSGAPILLQRLCAVLPQTKEGRLTVASLSKKSYGCWPCNCKLSSLKSVSTGSMVASARRKNHVYVLQMSDSVLQSGPLTQIHGGQTKNLSDEGSLVEFSRSPLKNHNLSPSTLIVWHLYHIVGDIQSSAENRISKQGLATQTARLSWARLLPCYSIGVIYQHTWIFNICQLYIHHLLTTTLDSQVYITCHWTGPSASGLSANFWECRPDIGHGCLAWSFSMCKL